MEKRAIRFFLALGVICMPLSALATEKQDDRYTLIDNLFQRAHQIAHTAEGMDLMHQSAELCENYLEQDPQDYELLWRYARSAGEYAESAYILQNQLPQNNWKDICRDWGQKGIDAASKAQQIAPERVEAYCWRTVCMDKFVKSAGIMNAVYEGALPKTKHDVKSGYQLDPAYLGHLTTYSYAMFLCRLPMWIEGSPKSKWTRAYEYYKEYSAATRDNFTELFEADVRAAHTGQFLLDVNEQLKLPDCEKTQNYRDARIYLEFALQSPRPVYRDWAAEQLQRLNAIDGVKKIAGIRDKQAN